MAISLPLCWGQGDVGPPSENTGQVASAQTKADDLSAATTEQGQTDNREMSDNQVQLGPGAIEAPREKQSFLVLNGAGGESADWSPLNWSTHVLGGAEVVKFWKRSASSLNYAGGAFIYQSNYSQEVSQIQQFTAAHTFLGRKRQLSLVDSFGGSNAGGTFGSSIFGGGLFDYVFAGTGVANSGGGLSLFSGGDIFGISGAGTQITNVAQATFTEALGHRSSVTVLAAYSVNAYFGSSTGLISGQAYSTAFQYNYKLNWRSSVGLLYGSRVFDYPLQPNLALSVRRLTSNEVQVSYRRILSRRLSLGGGVGPSFDGLKSEVIIDGLHFTNTTQQTNLSASGGLSYVLKNGSAGLSYQKATTSGSGIFAGSDTDLATASYNRTVSRTWGANLTTGYARLKEIQPASSSTSPSPSYQTWYAGATASKNVGRDFGLFISYEFANQSTSNAVCQLNRCVSRQSVVTIGLAWHGRTFRLDGLNPLTRDNADVRQSSESVDDSGEHTNSSSSGSSPDEKIQ